MIAGEVIREVIRDVIREVIREAALHVSPPSNVPKGHRASAQCAVHAVDAAAFTARFSRFGARGVLCGGRAASGGGGGGGDVRACEVCTAAVAGSHLAHAACVLATRAHASARERRCTLIRHSIRSPHV